MRLIRELEKQNSKFITELKEQKREIQELKRDLSQQCVNQGGIVVGNDCLKIQIWNPSVRNECVSKNYLYLKMQAKVILTGNLIRY